jgi:hypothetical protein
MSKYLHQTSFETLKYIETPCFETAYLGENVKHLLRQKVLQNVTISLGYFMFSKNYFQLPKVTISKKLPNLVTLVTGRSG